MKSTIVKMKRAKFSSDESKDEEPRIKDVLSNISKAVSKDACFWFVT